jgi:hypothetical protein
LTNVEVEPALDLGDLLKGIGDLEALNVQDDARGLEVFIKVNDMALTGVLERERTGGWVSIFNEGELSGKLIYWLCETITEDNLHQ